MERRGYNGRKKAAQGNRELKQRRKEQNKQGGGELAIERAKTRAFEREVMQLREEANMWQKKAEVLDVGGRKKRKENGQDSWKGRR